MAISISGKHTCWVCEHPFEWTYTHEGDNSNGVVSMVARTAGDSYENLVKTSEVWFDVAVKCPKCGFANKTDATYRFPKK